MDHKSETEEEKEVRAKKIAKAKRDQKLETSMRKINSEHGAVLKRLAE
jgi:hypothetical protein